MKKFTLLVLAMLLTLNLFAQEDRAKWFSEELQGTITAIDTDSREVTVVGQEGNIVTLMAGDEVERFNELEVGDLIKLEYWTFTKAPTAAPGGVSRSSFPASAIITKGSASSSGVGFLNSAIIKIQYSNLMRSPTSNSLNRSTSSPAMMVIMLPS